MSERKIFINGPYKTHTKIASTLGMLAQPHEWGTLLPSQSFQVPRRDHQSTSGEYCLLLMPSQIILWQQLCKDLQAFPLISSTVQKVKKIISEAFGYLKIWIFINTSIPSDREIGLTDVAWFLFLPRDFLISVFQFQSKY